MFDGSKIWHGSLSFCPVQGAGHCGWPYFDSRQCLRPESSTGVSLLRSCRPAACGLCAANECQQELRSNSHICIHICRDDSDLAEAYARWVGRQLDSVAGEHVGAAIIEPVLQVLCCLWILFSAFHSRMLATQHRTLWPLNCFPAHVSGNPGSRICTSYMHNKHPSYAFQLTVALLCFDPRKFANASARALAAWLMAPLLRWQSMS